MLFDIGSQLNFVHRELANRLELEEMELTELNKSTFGTRYHTVLPTMKTLTEIRNKDKERTVGK